MNDNTPTTARREFLAAGGLGAALLLASGKTTHAEGGPTATEKANEKVVNEFCAAFDNMDIDELLGYLDDKIVFRMIDNMPFVEGKDALRTGFSDFFATRTTAHFEMIRSTVIGNIVVNERIDHFGKEEGAADAFHVTGVFCVKNGKITEWRDYMVPQG